MPQQHGAWAMLAVPAVTGTTLLVRDHGWRWAALPVLALTLLGYLLLNATSLWLRSWRKARYLPPVRAYASATAILGLITLLLAPALAGWLVPAAPLVGVALVLAARRQDRALASGLVTVTAACLVTPVLWSAGLPGRAPLGALTAVADAVRDPAPRRAAGVAVLTTVAQLTYFVGTVAYVKTMIRERGDRGWLVGSVAYHAACTLALLTAAALGTPPLVHPLARWALVVLMGVTTARAALMPRLAARPGRTITPLQVGLLELGLSAALLACCLAL
ncbi:YwiC-like family protein [Arsenicicoccus dermatophilus]|uniref:YwiC-like family protein n=1 Tax=Arsenicicoccus dermatophilus TaxID=1076331 RepID=UPI003916D273